MGELGRSMVAWALVGTVVSSSFIWRGMPAQLTAGTCEAVQSALLAVGLGLTLTAIFYDSIGIGHSLTGWEILGAAGLVAANVVSGLKLVERHNRRQRLAREAQERFIMASSLGLF